jgi:hypothetical protein
VNLCACTQIGLDVVD